MSRIGKQSIIIPSGVSVSVVNNILKITGPKGTLENKCPKDIKVEEKEGKIFITSNIKNEAAKPMYGTFRALIANAVKGVSEGWSKKLELVGTGYRAEVAGKDLRLTVGYSQPAIVSAPDNITFKVEKNVITVDGIDKEVVGQISAKIRSVRPPEPYKGKGILYLGEVIRRKAGKAAKAQGQAA
ncbi:50S ribosomal protein L6 [Candidatus Woesebacteria bacterium RBG_16_36_11]|uniref:Large ribosomal subunit protein uL6 n=3 Tax=Candidatus Woeseibacteriota TaxID=1752722 RepID=A0A1F7XC51_9BACT|nr:MAG: 50S ribosomal protein L6 [Candidatus Woesebacteria bacterium RBG_13_36_22]OGM12349.1 MAG: 50S ribosomal protein L6 [Candidatus Woesebacteria bacterium RBG_16_36_11]OGM17232.1 MAG: 50S ribosomal protein L6 [Candidatus Woesebacteria bacterium RBG_19FT_COMBO_37_29]